MAPRLPTLVELARSQARFTHYEGDRLWYEVTWVGDDSTDARPVVGVFAFPIYVSSMAMVETAEDAARALEIALDGQYGYIVDRLREEAARIRKEASALGGRFDASDRAIRFMRWITPHLKWLRESAPPETDDELRTRIANKYGMWGAFLSHVAEASGAALDECAAHVGLTRRMGGQP